jgi:chain length determinant protein EpsF
MDLNQFLLALNARRKVFALVFAATVLTALVVLLIVPNNYVATTTVLIDSRDEQAMSPATVSPRERTGYIQTQVDMILSGRVAQKVARDLKLAQAPGVREEFERDTGGAGSIDDWIAQNLLRKLKVDTGASNLIIIMYSARDPKFAADVANAFAKAYMDTALAIRTEATREASEWFDEQLKGLRANVMQAQTKLAAYQKERGIAGIDETRDGETTRLAELSTQLSAARGATYDAVTRHKQAVEMLEAGAAADTIPDIVASTYIQGIKAEVRRAESTVEQLSRDYGENHPTYQKALAESQALKDRLGAEIQKVVNGLGSAAQQARKREQELANALTAQQQQMLEMKKYRVELSTLTRDVESAQRTYDAALGRYLTTKVESRARQSNLAVLTPAAIPLKPSSPKVGLISGLSVLIGALLAAGVVFGLETMDRRVRSRADLEARLAVPSLGRLSKWQPTGGRLLPSPARAARTLPHPW